MKIDPRRKLADIATDSPQLIPVLERLGLDYCCAGKRTLEEALADKGLALDEVLPQLDEAAADRAGGDERNWAEAAPSEIIVHILERYHRRLREDLPRLDALIARVLGAHAARHGATLEPLAETFRFLRDELEMHMHKEERVLFPHLLEVESASGLGTGLSAAPGFAGGAIGVMEREHESAALALTTMRRLTGGYAPPEDACDSFRALYSGLSALEADLKRHIHLENNVLFPKALEMEARLGGG